MLGGNLRVVLAELRAGPGAELGVAGEGTVTGLGDAGRGVETDYDVQQRRRTVVAYKRTPSALSAGRCR